MKINCKDCNKVIVFKNEKSKYVNYLETNGYIEDENLENSTDDELINIGYIRIYKSPFTNEIINELDDDDYKFGYKSIISKATDIECKKCYTKHENCYKCNKHHKSSEMNKYYCINCYNIIKNENPTNNNNVCKFDEDKLI